MSLFALLLAAAIAPVVSTEINPLGPGLAGMLQCYQPDAENKTCSALASYRLGADGVILNEAEVMLSPTPWINVVTISPVRVKGGAVCGELSGLDTMKVLVNGQPADATTTDKVRQLLTSAYGPYAGKEICTTYVAEPELFLGGYAYRAEAAIDGEAEPDMTQRMIWVYPEGEWAVRP